MSDDSLPISTSSMDVTKLAVPELLRAYGLILDELRVRGVVRSINNPVSDLAERLFCIAFPDWTRESSPQSGYDAVDPGKLRYQIKGRRLLTNCGSRLLSAIRNLPNDPFDHLAGVLFDKQFCIVRAAIVPLDVVKERARFNEHTNSWRFVLREDVWDDPSVLDVTEKIRNVATRL